MFVPLWLLPTSSERQEAPGHEPKRIFLAYKYKATCVYNIYIFLIAGQQRLIVMPSTCRHHQTLRSSASWKASSQT